MLAFGVGLELRFFKKTTLKKIRNETKIAKQKQNTWV